MGARAGDMASGNGGVEGLGPETDEKIPTIVVKWSGRSQKGNA